MSKLLIGIAIIFIIFVLLIIFGRKSVHHEIYIDDSPENVWKVLTDMNSYDQWNPVMRLIEGEVKERNSVKYQFTQDEKNISEIPSKVEKIIKNKLLNQSGGFPLILTFNHKYILEPQNNGTKVTIHEDYRGIGVNFWNPKPVGDAYAKLNKALKKRVENLN